MKTCQDDNRNRRAWPTLYRVAWTTLTLIVLMMFVSACSGNIRTGEMEIYGIDHKIKGPAFPETGSNKVQLLTEMHYQPSYRSQEAPRLHPPNDSVPITGKELKYDTLEEYKLQTIPDHLNQSYNSVGAQVLFSVNCMMCHGPSLKGQAEENEAERASILHLWPRNSNTGNLVGPTPANLLSDTTKQSTDGELFAFISRGGRQGFAATERGIESRSPMPEFIKLLTEGERWQLVMYLRSKQGLR